MNDLWRIENESDRCQVCDAPSMVKVEPYTEFEVWWCKTHGIGQHYDGDDPWWDDWLEYQCAFKAEYPVEGKCEAVKVTVTEATDAS